MKKSFLFFLIIFLNFSFPGRAKFNESPAETGKKKDFRVIAFFKGNLEDADRYEAGKLTHLVFCFTHLQGNKIAFENEADETILKRLVLLKEKHRKLKILISFGGWGGCEYCSPVFDVDSNRTAFVNSVKEMVVKYQADGFDMDWESPVIGGYKNHKASPRDRDNFTLLMSELRQKLPAGSELCFDANSFSESLEKSFDWAKVMPLVNFVNLMTYTLPFDKPKHTGHHAALYSSNLQSESADKAIKYLDSIKVPMSKIIIGAAFYSMSYENVDSLNNGLYRPGKFKAYINYNQLASGYLENPDYTYHWDSVCMAPYLYSSQHRTFVTFDDKNSVSQKTTYALRHQLGGIMFWRINGDVPKEGLLNAIHQTLNK